MTEPKMCTRCGDVMCPMASTDRHSAKLAIDPRRDAAWINVCNGNRIAAALETLTECIVGPKGEANPIRVEVRQR